VPSHQLGYPLSFRGQVFRVHGPFPCVPPMALSSRRLPFLLRVPASPVPRSQQYYEGATTSHLRIHGHLLVRFHCPRDPSCFRVPLLRSRKIGGLFRARALVSPAAQSPACSCVDAHGISQVSRRSFPCLCSVPRPRSNRCTLTMSVTSMLPPLPIRRRLRHWLISGLTPAASAPADLRFAFRVTTHAQGSLPAGWLAFAGRASNPLDRYKRFQTV
jgi:hypothetical protein